MSGADDVVKAALKLIFSGSDDAAKRIASIRRSEPFPADYIEPGSVRYRYEHPDTSSFMEIITRPKGARSASVIGLEVPEEYRGTGIGKALQERVLQDYPSLMGQVSSKAAAVNAYKAGRRPLANPNATLEDVFKMIDEDSSVNLATEKNIGGSIRQGYGPGGWVDDVVKMAGKVISGEGDDAAKAGIRAYHGTPQQTENLIDLFHGTTPEAFDAITSSGDIFGSSRFSPRRDVAETFAHNVGGNANTVVKVKAPASSLMVDLDLPAAKLLTPDEAAAYLDKPDWTILDFIENGYSVGVPDTSVLSIDRAVGGRIAKGPGGWIDDVVKMAGKVISGEGEEAAKTGIRAYQGSPHNFAAERLVRFPEGRTEYIVGQPDVLPDVPQGAEVVQDFPLGRMRMDKIGTGEGAQAYGHGLYLAEHEPVAQGYKDALRRKGDEITFDNMPLKEPRDYNAIQSQLENQEGDWRLFKAVDEITTRQGSMEDRLGDIRNWYRNQPEMLAAIDRAEKRMTLKENPGFVYETNISADPATFLDWDKPLSEQPEAVRRALEASDVFKSQGYRNPNDPSLKGSTLYDDFGIELGNPKNVSQKLREAGIPGIKYLDAGSRGKGVAQVQVMYKGKPHGDPIPVQAWNQVDQLTNDYKAKGYDVEVQDIGTRNYVVFDDRLISIIRKYGIAGASAMLGYNLMEQLDPKQALAASMADQDYQASRPQRSMGGNNSISGALNVARGINGGK